MRDSPGLQRNVWRRLPRRPARRSQRPPTRPFGSGLSALVQARPDNEFTSRTHDVPQCDQPFYVERGPSHDHQASSEADRLTQTFDLNRGRARLHARRAMMDHPCSRAVPAAFWTLMISSSRAGPGAEPRSATHTAEAAAGRAAVAGEHLIVRQPPQRQRQAPGPSRCAPPTKEGARRRRSCWC